MTRTRTDRIEPAAGIEFDGTPVPFTPGQTIGGALAGAGIVSWRTTRRDHAPRGLFCGIGVCFDCLVTVDGVRSQRACLVEACAGQVVQSSDPDEPLALPDAPEPSVLTVPSEAFPHSEPSEASVPSQLPVPSQSDGPSSEETHA